MFDLLYRSHNVNLFDYFYWTYCFKTIKEQIQEKPVADPGLPRGGGQPQRGGANLLFRLFFFLKTA